MKKILILFGTRPEAIKMAPLVKEFQKHQDKFQTRVCITAQHRDMLDQVLDFFKIEADYDLNLMKPGQNLHELTSRIINETKSVFDSFLPDYVFVHGDTTTAMASALSAFYSGSKVCHVEAGLRTFNKLSPFPEEINRQVIGRIADFHFSPTLNSKNNLLKEGIDETQILVTGNTVIDALLQSIDLLQDQKSEEFDNLRNVIDLSKRIVLVTGHRRENHGKGFDKICKALKSLANSNKDIQIIYPVHLNPKVIDPVTNHLSHIENIKLIAPLSYPSFIWLMNHSYLILTDSGGVQEEAPSLGKPVLVMRDTTERPEAVEAGTVKLVGTDENEIIKQSNLLLNNKEAYNSMSQLNNPYGDGIACELIVKFMIMQGCPI